MDRPIESQLLPEERIEHEYNVSTVVHTPISGSLIGGSLTGGSLVITNKRIILYDLRPWWELSTYRKFVQDIDYRHIVSTKFIETSNLWLLIFSIPLLLFGIYLFGNQDNIIKVIGIGLIIIVVVLTIVAFDRKIYLQIFTTSSDAKVNWQLHSGSAEEIMLSIRKHLAKEYECNF